MLTNKLNNIWTTSKFTTVYFRLDSTLTSVPSFPTSCPHSWAVIPSWSPHHSLSSPFVLPYSTYSTASSFSSYPFTWERSYFHNLCKKWCISKGNPMWEWYPFPSEKKMKTVMFINNTSKYICWSQSSKCIHWRVKMQLQKKICLKKSHCYQVHLIEKYVRGSYWVHVPMRY